MQIIAIVTYHLIPFGWLLSQKKKMTVDEDVEKLESLCVTGENVKLYSHCGKQHSSSSKNNMIQWFRFWVYIQNSSEQGLKKLFVCLFS